MPKRRTARTAAKQPDGIFTPAQRRTLVALAEGFVAGGGPKRAAAAEQALATVVDPSLHGQLRLILNLLDSRTGALMIGGVAAPFRTLTGVQRDTFLRRWVQHPVPLMRSGAAVFRKLLAFIAYSDAEEPADGNVRKRLAKLGYKVKVNTTVREISKITAFDPGSADTISADVLVIGSGAGGGSVARDLAVAGRDVLVIEAGGLYTEKTFPTRERDAYQQLYLDSGFTATADAHIAILAGGTVGGGTTINWMTCIPVPDNVRADWAEEHGVEGVSSTSFTRDLQSVMREIGAQESEDLPAKDAAILRGAAALRWSGERIVVNRSECDDCGTRSDECFTFTIDGLATILCPCCYDTRNDDFHGR
jgi:hypothetical protein